MAKDEPRNRKHRGRRGAVSDEIVYGPAPPSVHPSIASLRGRHRAAHPDKGTILVPYSHMLMVHEWPITCPRFKAAIRRAGLHCVSQLLYIQLDHHLLTALVERWCPQTNTFHLVVGEMTITLQDVAMLMGLQVDGYAVIGPSQVGMGKRWSTWPDCCDELLGDHPDPNVLYHDPANPEVTATFRMGQNRSQTCMPLRWLRWTFLRESYTELDDVLFWRHVRAYILFIIGCFLLPDTSGSEIHLQYLPLLEDIEVFSTYSLGSAVLAHLYRELSEATKPSRVKIAGCIHLLQIWAWEHIHVGRPRLHVPISETLEGASVGVRWNEEWPRERPLGNVDMYRDELDGLLQSQVIWEPYTEAICTRIARICLVGVHIWMARAPLICWKRVEWHLPDRVIRQFGYFPRMDILPMEPTFVRVDGRGKADVDWLLYHQQYVTIWEARRELVVHGQSGVDVGDRALNRYMHWYTSWATLYLLNAPCQAPNTYYARAPIERLMREHILETEEIFRPFFGQESNSDMQRAINKYEELYNALRSQVYITDTRYHEQPDSVDTDLESSATYDSPSDFCARPSSLVDRGPSQQFTSPVIKDLGIRTEYQQWPNTEIHWGPSNVGNSSQQYTPTATQFFTPANIPPFAHLTVHLNDEHTTDHVKEHHDLRHRPVCCPDHYSPGRDALPRRHGKKR